MEEWREIRSFPGYSVSSMGRVRNDETDRLMALLINQFGIVNVGLTKNRVQYKRAVTPLVAEAFVVRPHESFDTPINLNGKRDDNDVSNLMWRPRWFAIKYNKQFESTEPLGFTVPIEDIDTGERFENSWEAATKYGLLDREIALATMNCMYVWPTYQIFRVII